MIRGLKGMLALLALAALGLALRWATAGSIKAANSHDLDSLTALAVGTVAWIAYGWLLLAVIATALEQLPGALGAIASVVAARITSQTSRTLLRTALGAAAVTPLTLTTAHATPPAVTATPTDLPLRATEASFRAVEPPSTVRLTSAGAPRPQARAHHSTDAHPAGDPAAAPDATNWRATEPPSSVRLGGPAAITSTHHSDDVRAARPENVASPASHGAPEDTLRRTGASKDDRTRTGVPADIEQPVGVPGGRVRVGVPDRPTSGAATRYTELKSGQPVRVPPRVVVKPGDTLWSIAAAELGANATPEAVAARWPEWYAANRERIGPDPDLILPGQVLRIPASATGNPVPPTHQEN